MPEFRHARLIATGSGETVLAEFCDLDRTMAKGLSTHWGTDNWWKAVREPIRSVEEEVDFHWDWTGVISRDVLNKPMGRSVCVRTDDGLIQGAMIYRIGAKSVLEPGEKVVFVDRIATAPWNRDTLVYNPRYRRVGTSLLRFAMLESLKYGFNGRVTLFPIANLEFYRSEGFQRTSETSTDGDALFELPERAALNLLKSAGIIS